MKVVHIFLVSLGLLLAGGWADRGLRAEGQGSVETVESNGPSAQSHGNDKTVLPPGQLPRIQEKLISDEAIFKKIQALQDDPDIQAVLSDPVLMDALRAGDLNAVTSNPKFMRLLENPAVQEIMKGVR